MRRGTIGDWYELQHVLDAWAYRRISFSRFAELGKMWLNGATAEDLAGELPMSQPERIVHYLRGHGGVATARNIDEALDFPTGRTAELCGRLRPRGLIKTVRSGNQIELQLLDVRRRRDKSGNRGKR